MKLVPIQRKLLAASFMTSLIVLLLTCLALLGYELASYKRIMARNLTTLSQIIAANSTAILIYDDETVAREILSGLKAEPGVVAACLYNRNGRLYASYPADLPLKDFPPTPGPDGLHFSGQHVTINQPIVQGHSRVGTLFIKQDLAGVYNRLLIYSLVVLLVLTVSLGVAFLLSELFQRAISQPIIALAGVARAVSERKDYSVRAKKTGTDELGLLTDAFNDMLEQIQQRDAALQAAQQELQKHAQQLEARVVERTKSLQETTDQLNAFVYTIAHDLRAPLRAQVGYARMLLEEFGPILGQTGAEYLQRLCQAAERQGLMVQDLLSHVRVSREDLPLEPVDLTLIVEQVRSDLAVEIVRQEATVHVDHLDGPVMANPASLHLVIQNLISNAIKYVATGTRPEVRLWTERRGDLVRLWVEDNGIGIEPKYLNKLFGVFQRLHTSEQYPGTGIGLAIVKKAAERMGGQVGVESEVGKGSRFWVELNFAAEPTKNGPAARNRNAAAPAHSRQERRA